MTITTTRGSAAGVTAAGTAAAPGSALGVRIGGMGRCARSRPVRGAAALGGPGTSTAGEAR